MIRSFVTPGDRAFLSLAYCDTDKWAKKTLLAGLAMFPDDFELAHRELCARAVLADLRSRVPARRSVTKPSHPVPPASHIFIFVSSCLDSG